eukprot:1196318-Prorocentrum_minimum.AAC.3
MAHPETLLTPKERIARGVPSCLSASRAKKTLCAFTDPMSARLPRCSARLPTHCLLSLYLQDDLANAMNLLHGSSFNEKRVFLRPVGSYARHFYVPVGSYARRFYDHMPRRG